MRLYLLAGLLVLMSGMLFAQQTKTLPRYKAETLLTSFDYEYEGVARKVPIKVYFPKSKTAKKLPVIMMSHGLGGSREIGNYLGLHWAKNGFVVVAMQHKGSDIEIIKGKQRREYVKTFKKAMSLENFLNRVDDVSESIDQVSKWNADRSHALYGKLDLQKIGMCGHSFGAVTTQAVSGQSFPVVGQKYTDKRIKAAFAMSPSSSRFRKKADANEAKKAFGEVSIPWLRMTGTADKAFMTPHVDVVNRKKVYSGLPAGDKYQLVLNKANHMAFSDKTILGKNHKNPKHHQAIQAISTAFFKAYLSNDKKAKNWLQSDKVQMSLEGGDSWEQK